MSPTPSAEERIARLEWEVEELKKDLAKLNGIATTVAIIKNDVKAQSTRLNWVIGLLGTFSVALFAAAITLALNAFGGG